jgi:regulation of enolase protein 1 (concanavalin A-like superfamily)
MRVAAVVVLALFGAQDKWAVEDPFAGKLGKGWSWTREAAGGHAFDKAALKIKPLPGSLAEKANSTKNLLLRALPPGEDGVVAVEVEVANAPAVEGEEAGILLYQDDDHWTKLSRIYVDGKLKVGFEREARGFPSPAGQREEAGASHRLRLRWEDRRVQAEILPAGAPKWIIAGYCEAPFTNPEGVKVALFAQGAPADAARWASFSGFRAGVPAPVAR